MCYSHAQLGDLLARLCMLWSIQEGLSCVGAVGRRVFKYHCSFPSAWHFLRALLWVTQPSLVCIRLETSGPKCRWVPTVEGT
jgi:hypothetical protein